MRGETAADRSGIAPLVSRPGVRKLDPYVPGTTVEEVRRKLGLERIVKLASNENPLGSSPKAMAALAHIDRLHLYFDDAHTELRDRLAAPYGLRAENTVLGHGSNELVNIVCETVLEPGDEAVMASPKLFRSIVWRLPCKERAPLRCRLRTASTISTRCSLR